MAAPVLVMASVVDPGLIADPSIADFRRMANSEIYQTAGPARTAAVLDSRLILTHQKFPR